MDYRDRENPCPRKPDLRWGGLEHRMKPPPFKPPGPAELGSAARIRIVRSRLRKRIRTRHWCECPLNVLMETTSEQRYVTGYNDVGEPGGNPAPCVVAINGEH